MPACAGHADRRGTQTGRGAERPACAGHADRLIETTRPTQSPDFMGRWYNTRSEGSWDERPSSTGGRIPRDGVSGEHLSFKVLDFSNCTNYGGLWLARGPPFHKAQPPPNFVRDFRAVARQLGGADAVSLHAARSHGPDFESANSQTRESPSRSTYALHAIGSGAAGPSRRR